MEILLAVSLNVSLINTELDYVGVSFTNYFAIVFFVLSAGLPIWMLVFFWVNFSKWEDEEFLKKYSPVLEGTRKSYIEFEEGKTWIGLVYPILTLVRRIGFVITVVFYPDFTWL